MQLQQQREVFLLEDLFFLVKRTILQKELREFDIFLQKNSNGHVEEHFENSTGFSCLKAEEVLLKLRKWLKLLFFQKALFSSKFSSADEEIRFDKSIKNFLPEGWKLLLNMKKTFGKKCFSSKRSS